jgi:hypothetical protein
VIVPLVQIPKELLLDKYLKMQSQSLLSVVLRKQVFDVNKKAITTEV